MDINKFKALEIIQEEPIPAKPQVTYPIPAGELPKRGDLLNIGGLMFEVQFVDYKREKITIQRIKNYKLMGDGTPVKIPNRILRMR